MKRDYREIELTSGMSDERDDDVDSGEVNSMIMRSTRPPAPPESNMLSKKRRYTTWANDEKQMAADICSYHDAVSYIQKELRSVEKEQER